MYEVLEGTIRFKADGRYFEAPAGAFMFIPRGTPHCFLNVGDVLARLLVMFAPAGMERFFEGHAALPPGPTDPEAYRLSPTRPGWRWSVNRWRRARARTARPQPRSQPPLDVVARVTREEGGGSTAAALTLR
jgi:hypothetical protein